MRADEWSPAERAVLAGLATPAAIQAFLDSFPYSDDAFYRCPRRVLADRKGHCFDGAVLAAAALRRLGHPPLLLDMRAVNDDDHVIAPFRAHGGWGAVAKSNFAGIRFREPIYRTLRELVMSYFEAYFNLAREKTLRSYSRPVSLRPFDRRGWETRDEIMERIAARLEAAHHVELLTRDAARALSPVDERSYAAGTLGLDPAGVYKPR